MKTFKHSFRRNESTENCLGILLNTSPNDLSKIFEDNNSSINIISNPNNLFNSEQNSYVAIDNGLTGLFSVIQYLKNNPIIWVDSVTAYYLQFYFKIIVLDSNIHPDGIISFKKPNFKKLVNHLSKEFTSPSYNNFYVDHLGLPALQNKFDHKLRLFLRTLPFPAQEPFLIALLLSFKENDFSIINNFVSHNRLFTANYNKKYFIPLGDYLFSIKDDINLLLKEGSSVIETAPSDRHRSVLHQIMFLISNFSRKNLKIFLDEERTLTPKQYNLARK